MAKIELSTLRPEYTEDRHGLYVQALTDALNKSGADRPVNIAVTGPYGSGKSSVLHRLAEDFDGRSLIIELSSLGGDEPAHDADGQVKNSTSPVVTKFIQKEIVKQLLFRQPPSSMRGTHYRRVEPFNEQRAWGVAAMLTATLFVLAIAAGGLDLLSSRLPAVPDSAHPFVVAVLLVCLFASIIAIQRLAHGRFRIEKLSAGPATISLSDQASYYFDEYLDEILFFFESTGHDLVIFEDIDRFDNPHIFDTLRELNTILNNSQQLGRPIRFVYAMKDSIFDQIPVRAPQAGLSLSPATTNRTKFFDLVVPIVPFISHKTSRAHLAREMRSTSPVPSDTVVALVSRYLTDMRLMKNIRNEYSIFAPRILDESGIKDLKPDNLFAMIVFKNVYLSEFEKISVGASTLDTIFDLVNSARTASILELDRKIGDARRKLEIDSAREERAQVLGDRLEHLIRATTNPPYAWREVVTVAGVQYEKNAFRTVDFWNKLVVAAEISVPFTSGHALSLTPDELGRLFRTNLSKSAWARPNVEALNEEIQAHEERKETLLSQTIAETLVEAGLPITVPRTVDDENSEDVLLIDAVQEAAGSRLVLDLVEAGFIDQNFPLYATQYDGGAVNAGAMTFILRAVQKSRAEYNYKFEETSWIDQVVSESSDEFLGSEAVLNLDVFDYFLKHKPELLARAKRILVNEGEHEFVDLYLQNGREPGLFAALLAPVWPTLFTHVVALSGLPAATRRAVLGAALGAASTRRLYATNEAVQEALAADYVSLPIFAEPMHETEVHRAAQVSDQLGVRYSDLSVMSHGMRAEIVARGSYVLSQDNLAVATGIDDPDLGFLKAEFPDVYDKVRDELGAFVRIVEANGHNTIKNQDSAVAVLHDLSDLEDDVAAQVVALASPELVIEHLHEAPPVFWPSLVGGQHVLTTWANVLHYFESCEDTVDSELAKLLSATPTIQGIDEKDEATRGSFAVAVVNSPEMTTETKVNAIESLKLERWIDPESITYGGDPTLMASLVAARHVADTEAAYENIQPRTFAAKLNLIHVSTQFPDYVGNISLSEQDLLDLAKDPELGDRAAEAILKHLPAIETSVTPLVASAWISTVFRSGQRVNDETLILLAARSADPQQIVELLETRLVSIGRTTLAAILETLGAPYSDMPLPGGHIWLPNDDAHVALVARAEGVGITTSHSQDRKNPHLLKVNRHRRARP